MTAQTDRLAGTIGHAPTATLTAGQLAAYLERARTAARAAPSPENLALHHAAYAARHGPALRRAARRDLLRGVAEAAIAVGVVGLVGVALTLLAPAAMRLVAAIGMVVGVCSFVAMMAWCGAHTRPAPPAPTIAPSPCICGNAPTLHHRHGTPPMGDYWLLVCPCDALLSVMGNTPDAVWATWESVVIEARHSRM